MDHLPWTKIEQKNLKKQEIQYIFNETKLAFSTIWLTEISQIYIEILREKASNIAKNEKKLWTPKTSCLNGYFFDKKPSTCVNIFAATQTRTEINPNSDFETQQLAKELLKPILEYAITNAFQKYFVDLLVNRTKYE